MSLFIASLNSGSNGNCYYVGNQKEAVLIDAGISCRETEKRMLRLGLSMQKLKAIFVSHEHSDHIRGIEVLARKYRLPVYVTSTTFNKCRIDVDEALVTPFTGYKPVNIGQLAITAFPKLHDACEPHSFTIACDRVKVGVFTDIGTPCYHVRSQFKQCHAAFLEANYDEELLQKGNYPYHLKNRIRSGYGHLSNRQALELFTSHRANFMSHLLLSHLSKDNNSPQIVSELFNLHANCVNIVVASRYIETAVYQISTAHTEVVRPVQMKFNFIFD